MTPYDATDILNRLLGVYELLQETPDNIIGDIGGARADTARSIKILAEKIHSFTLLAKVKEE